jgi:rod shape-determining protein MreC
MENHSTGRKWTRRCIYVGIGIFFALFFSAQGPLTFLIGPLAARLVRMGTWVSDQVFWWQESRHITAQELQDLYEDRSQLVQKATLVNVLQEENALLKEQLGFIQRTEAQAIATSILAKSVSGSVSRFVIDAGTQDGAQAGAAVVSGEGMYVGKIIEAGNGSATVSVLTDSTHTVAVSLYNEGRTIGVASGLIGDLLQINFIPTDEIVQENDIVVTSGLEAAIPSGLIVGIVNAVSQETGSPFQQAIVEPLIDIRRLSSVLVLTTPQFP